jgi:hypothetical protein
MKASNPLRSKTPNQAPRSGTRIGNCTHVPHALTSRCATHCPGTFFDLISVSSWMQKSRRGYRAGRTSLIILDGISPSAAHMVHMVHTAIAHSRHGTHGTHTRSTTATNFDMGVSIGQLELCHGRWAYRCLHRASRYRGDCTGPSPAFGSLNNQFRAQTQKLWSFGSSGLATSHGSRIGRRPVVPLGGPRRVR